MYRGRGSRCAGGTQETSDLVLDVADGTRVDVHATTLCRSHEGRRR
jgi:hypothetical protein